MRMARWSGWTLALLFGLAACGGRDSGAPPQVQQSEATAAAAARKDFALDTPIGESYDGRASIVLPFSQPLVSQQAFDELIAITLKDGAKPDGSWMLEDGQKLRFPYLEADKTYVVTIRGGLMATDGRSLGKDQTHEVYAGEQEPVIGFASHGHILPQHESRGLPIVSVNVAEADVEFFRIREQQVRPFIDEFQKNGTRWNWSVDQLTKYGESVYANRFALELKRNERSVSYLPIRDIDEMKAPGLYYAVLKKAGSYRGEYDTAMFFVSDIGLHVRAYADKLLVHTTSLETGEAKPNVAIEIRDRKGQTLVSAASDDHGLAMIAYTLSAADTLVANWGNDHALLSFNTPALDLSEFAIAGRSQLPLDVFPWSGRDLYRPGEMIGVNAILRDFDGRMVAKQPLFVSLRQPDGRELARTQLDPGALNYVRYERVLDGDVPTGKWSVDFSTDPGMLNPVSYPVRVEEFLPERMKLVLDAQPTLTAGEALQLKVDGDWLYGAPAAGNRFTARVSVQADVHPVAALKDFHFGDPLAELPKEPREALDDVLDEEGLLEAEIAIDEAKAPTGPLQVIVVGSLFESGGRAVTRPLKRTIWPASELVGARPLFDLADGADPGDNAGFEIVRSNPNGDLLAGAGLKLKLLREIRNYNWRWVSGSGWQSDYLSRFETVEERSIDVAAGSRLRYDARVDWGGYRLEIFDPATQLTTRLPFTAGWNWYNEGQDRGSRPDKVKLALDKAAYAPGDTAKIAIKPPHAGSALILVESDQLLWQQRIDVRGETTLDIPVAKEWDRHDLYITALVFRPGSSAEKITPNRAVGVIHLPLDRKSRKVEVSVSAPDKARPDQSIEVKLAAPALAGKTAQVTMSATDVGILNLTQFPLPDPIAWFFSPRRHGINAYDLFGRIIESLDGLQARLRYGGDAALLGLPQAKRPNVKVQTIDLFNAPVALDAQGNAAIALKLPDFNGTLRLAAVAFGESQYGAGEREIIVQAPLVVEASAPRAMASGDSAELALDLDNLSGAEGSYEVLVDGGDYIQVGNGKRNVKLADGDRTTLNFPLSAREKFGVAKVRIEVRGKDIRVDRSIEFAVRPAYPVERRARVEVLGANPTITPAPSLRSGLVSESTVSRVTLGTLPPLPFGSVVADLIGYPYGCVEQTTSKAFPLVYLDEATAKQFAVSPLTQKERAERMTVAFSRLASMQVENGHFNMWPEGDYIVSTITPYVAEMLVAAKDAGFEPPATLLDRTLKRLEDDLLAGGNPHYDYEYSEHLRLAEMMHAGYVLARQKRAPLGTLRALYDNERSKLIAPLPLVHLGVALVLQGDKDRGEKAIEEAFTREFKRPAWIGDYGTDLRDLALMVALTHEAGLAQPAYDAKVFAMAREITGRNVWDGRFYFSTQEQIALFRLGRALLNDPDRKIEGDVFAGELNEPFAPTAQIARSFTAPDLAAGVKLDVRGDGPIYLTEDVVGYPSSAPKQSSNGVAVRRDYYRLDGTKYDGKPLTEGDSLVAMVTVESDEMMKDALIVDLLPGGLEIENFNLGDQSQWSSVTIDGVTLSERGSEAEIAFEEYREDRYVAAIKLYDGSKARLFYAVRAVSPGTYKVPSSLVEDMYRPTLRGIGEAVPATIRVVSPE
ncbi:MAG: alpha-2-macroglobulin family protein [Xanthomonadales bacterium]|nr:alpha-2-macroglobulin family protein [Xanthomonadales bacterium]